VWMLLALACPMHAKTTDPVAGWLDAADAAWAARADGGLTAVKLPLDAARTANPRDERVLWRVARYHVAAGLAADADSGRIREFGAAREAGLDCLAARVGGLPARPDGAWAAALSELDVGSAECLGWTAYAWTRWMAVVGGRAGAIDWPRLDAVLDRTDAIGPPALADAARGLAEAIRPTPDYGVATRRLTQAALRDGADLVPILDLQRYVWPATQAPALQRFIDQQRRVHPPRTPEERGAASW
jgi:hypothetical protein